MSIISCLPITVQKGKLRIPCQQKVNCGDGKSLVCFLEHGQRTKLGAFALWDRQWREPYCFKFLDMLDTQYYTIKHLTVDSMDLLWMRSDSGVPHFKITPPTMSHLIGEWVKKRFYYDFS